MNKEIPRVAIYCRLSDEDRNKENKEDDSLSIQHQKLMLSEYAIKQGWDIEGIYSDDDYAGADRNRPQFNTVLRLAEARKIDIVLCKSQSRFTRELELVEKYINGLFIEWGIRFIGLVDNADTDVKGNKKSRQINGLVNEWYLEDMSENIKSVLSSKRQKGIFTGGIPLYGYLKDPNQKGHLIIDPVAAEVVREVFTLYDQGYGKTAIARILNDRAIPNPTQYKYEQGINYKKPSNELATLWKYFSISNMLENEMYIGNMVQGRYGSISYKTKKNKPKPKSEWVIVNGTHEAIIDIDLWNRVQSKISSNFKTFKNTGKIGLFAKKCKCKYCGYTLKSSMSHGDRYLRCPTKYVDSRKCVGCFISEKTLKKIILKELNSLITKYLNTTELEKNIAIKKFKKEKEQLQKEIIEYQEIINKKSKVLHNLYMDKVNEIISGEQFLEFNASFTKEKSDLENILHEKQTKLSQFITENDVLEIKKQILKNYTNVTELTRQMIENLVDYIEIGKKDLDTKKKSIEIHWKI